MTENQPEYDLPHVTLHGLTQWADGEGIALPDSGHQRALKMACRMIAHHLGTTTPPTDWTTVSEAAYAQASHWLTNNITPGNPAPATGSNVVASSSLLSGSVTFAGAEQQAENKALDATRLCFEARMLLAMAGARPTQPRVIG